MKLNLIFSVIVFSVVPTLSFAGTMLAHCKGGETEVSITEIKENLATVEFQHKGKKGTLRASREGRPDARLYKGKNFEMFYIAEGTNTKARVLFDKENLVLPCDYGKDWQAQNQFNY
jgi:hypothetical protein